MKKITIPCGDITNYSTLESVVIEGLKLGLYEKVSREQMTSKQDREENFLELQDKLKPNASNLLRKIKMHMNRLRNPSLKLINDLYTDGKFEDKRSLKWAAAQDLFENVVRITPEFIKHYELVNVENKKPKYANRDIKKFIKENVAILIEHQVLCHIGKEDTYLINPLFIYYSNSLFNDNFLDVYIRWCEQTNSEVDYEYIHKVSQVLDSNTHKRKAYEHETSPKDLARIIKQSEELNQVANTAPKHTPYPTAKLVDKTTVVSVTCARVKRPSNQAKKPWELPEDHPDFNPF